MATTDQTLNPGQQAAVAAIETWLANPDRASFFLLFGGAGTGKTFCVRTLIERRIGRIVFTAPTNKATKVLRQTLTSEGFKPECATTYSLLGLRLEANGEVKELREPEDPIDLNGVRLIVVDEGSMVNAELFKHLRNASDGFGIPVLVMGDAAQLPPVKETASPVWGIRDRAELTQVMRYGDSLLAFATEVREAQALAFPRIRVRDMNDSERGLFTLGPGFELRIREAAEARLFDIPDEAGMARAKVISWRNVKVDQYNRLIRSAIFGAEAARAAWLTGDRVIFTAPARTLDDQPLAATDDEGLVDGLDEGWHPLYEQYKVWNIRILLDSGRVVTARVMHEASARDYANELESLAATARVDKRRWRDYWALREAFHQLRHGYAVTAHRAQGSTYEQVFVDWRDILINQNRKEAYQCLYVAVTRAKHRVMMN